MDLDNAPYRKLRYGIAGWLLAMSTHNLALVDRILLQPPGEEPDAGRKSQCKKNQINQKTSSHP